MPRCVLYMENAIISQLIGGKTHQPLQGLDAAEERGSAILESVVKDRCRIKYEHMLFVSACEYIIKVVLLLSQKFGVGHGYLG